METSFAFVPHGATSERVPAVSLAADRVIAAPFSTATAMLRSLPPVLAILSVRVTLPPVKRLSESDVGVTEISGAGSAPKVGRPSARRTAMYASAVMTRFMARMPMVLPGRRIDASL